MLLLSWTCRWCSQPKITCVQVTGKTVQQVKCSPWKFEDPSSDAQCSHNKTGPAVLLSVGAGEEKTGTSQELAGQPTELNPLAPGSLRDPVSRKWVWEPLRETLKIDLWPPHTHMHTQLHTQPRKPASHLHSLEPFSTNYTAVRPDVLWRPFHNFGIELTTTVLVLKVMAFPTTNRLLNFPAQSVENGGSIKVLIQEVLVTSGLQQLQKDLQGLIHQNSSRRTHRRYNWECFGAWWATCSKSCYIQITYTKDHTESSPQRSLKSGGLFCKYDKLYHRREGENI